MPKMSSYHNSLNNLGRDPPQEYNMTKFINIPNLKFHFEQLWWRLSLGIYPELLLIGVMSGSEYVHCIGLDLPCKVIRRYMV